MRACDGSQQDQPVIEAGSAWKKRGDGGMAVPVPRFVDDQQELEFHLAQGWEASKRLALAESKVSRATGEY